MYITFYRTHEYKGFQPAQITEGPFESIVNDGKGKLIADDNVLAECTITQRGVEFPVFKDEPWTEFHIHEAVESGLDLPVKK
jgi:hypothetical protein